MKNEFNQIEKIAFNKGYRIDSLGNVLNSKGKELKKMIYNTNYYKFNIRYETKHSRVKVHRLQAYQKFGNEIYKEGIEVRHLDGNGLNNSIDNIEIGTHSENMMDQSKEQRLEKAIYASNHTIKFSDEIKGQIRDFHNVSKSYKETMEKFNISSKGSLHNILKNK